MPTSYWIKLLSDGTKERGSDYLIAEGKASWTRGRQDIVEAVLYFSNLFLTVRTVPSDKSISKWKQRDNYIYSSVHDNTQRVSREIWCQNLMGNNYSYGFAPNHVVFDVGANETNIVPNEVQWVVFGISQMGRVYMRTEK